MFKLFKYFRKRDIFFVIALVADIIFQVWADLTMPDYSSKLTELIATPEGLKMTDILYNGGMMLLFAFLTMVGGIIARLLTSIISSDWSKELRFQLMNKVMQFSDEEINHFSTPSLITRTTNDVVQCETLSSMGLHLLIKAPITAIWAICKISSTSLNWTYATLGFVLAIMLVVLFLILYALPKFKRIQKLTDDLNDAIRENLTGVRVIRAFNANAYQDEKFEKVNNLVTRNNLATSRSLGIMMPFMMCCLSSLTVVIYLIGGKMIIDETEMAQQYVILGNMTAYTQIAMQVIMSFVMLVVIFVILPRSIVSAKRINEVLDYKVRIKDGKSKEDVKNIGDVEFRNVSFSYSGDVNHNTLSNISFSIKKGETLAIIGATGSGKTTLINLLLRFLDIENGEIILNNKNIKDYSLSELHSYISLAPQKAVLFSGSVKRNITYGCSSNFDEEKFNRAIKTSSSDFVYSLKDKEESFVAQGGTNFSGGQKQRISIARALYKDSPIIVFDDTFSALDYKTDMLVRKNIKLNYKDKTIILIAQRIGTIAQADKIIVLDEGKIAGIGKHETLLKTCKVYKDIALSQLSEKELKIKEGK